MSATSMIGIYACFSSFLSRGTCLGRSKDEPPLPVIDFAFSLVDQKANLRCQEMHRSLAGAFVYLMPSF